VTAPRTDMHGQRIGNVRWLMVGLVFAVAAVAYLDRANISIAAPLIKKDVGLDNYQLGYVFSAFVFGYALSQPFAGRMADRFGAYGAIAIGILWWCVFTALTALIPAKFAGGFSALLIVRFLLGIGESVIFPASNKLLSSWIPTQERGLANGIIFAGVGIGAGLAPPVISLLMLAFDWRVAFWATALIGIAAAAIWMLLARDTPAKHGWVHASERNYIEAHLSDVPASGKGGERVLTWPQIVRNRSVAFLTLSYFCFGYVAYLFFTWFFTYMSAVRGLDLKSSALYGMLPFAAMAVASPLGGWIADGLTRRWGRRVGRGLFAACSMALATLFVALAPWVADIRLAVVVLAGGSGALYLSQSAFWAVSADLGRGSAGSVSGFMNMGNQLGGVLVAAITPWLSGYFGWKGSFAFTAGVALVGALCWLGVAPDANLFEDARRDGPFAKIPEEETS
jgi:ACS family glucarate transporter-like MFS transporter